MRVSIYWLTQATEKHRDTVKKRVAGLDADKHGRYDSAAALEAIYCGAPIDGNGEFISTPEAVRLLTIAKKEQIELQNQVARGTRIPIDDVNTVVNEVFVSMRGIVKANLPVEAANQVFDQMREVIKELRQLADEVGGSNGNGQHPASADSANIGD